MPQPHPKFPTAASAPRADTYSSSDVASKLGKSTDWFYEHRADLEVGGMPPPLPQTGQRRYPRVAIDMWLAGRTASQPLPAPANDSAPMAISEIDRWRAELAGAYGRRA